MPAASLASVDAGTHASAASFSVSTRSPCIIVRALALNSAELRSIAGASVFARASAWPSKRRPSENSPRNHQKSPRLTANCNARTSRWERNQESATAEIIAVARNLAKRVGLSQHESGSQPSSMTARRPAGMDVARCRVLSTRQEVLQRELAHNLEHAVTRLDRLVIESNKTLINECGGDRRRRRELRPIAPRLPGPRMSTPPANTPRRRNNACSAGVRRS